jgi:glycosyltransferase involved in cell wall biosynthesis
MKPDRIEDEPGLCLEHSFVVPAYGESPYLEECLGSLKNQTRPSQIIVCTSTPHDGLVELAAEYGAKLVVHTPNRGIGHDWNVALSQAASNWVTLAHQDDVYLPHFLERTLAAASADPSALLVFTDYEEWIDGVRRPGGFLPMVKSLLLELGFAGRRRVGSRWGKKNCVRFGNAIPCPAVTLNRRRYQVSFDEHMRVNLDWAAWLELCDSEGSFLRVREKLMAHRIHSDSETSNTIGNGYRATEDLLLLQRLWPRWMAGAIARYYARAYASNAQ